PGIRAWIVPPASIEHLIKEAGVATPDDHLTASPHCRVIAAGFGCVERAGGRPAVRFGIVSAAGFEEFERLTNWTKSTPDDHFSASPDCRVTGSASGRVGRAGGGPTIGAGIVSAAGVQKVVVNTIVKESAPDDHFTAGPHGR